MTAEVSANTDTKKFVPIVRANPGERVVPIFLGSRLFVDFRDDDHYKESLEKLARDLHGIYRMEKPPLGTPDFAAPAGGSATMTRHKGLAGRTLTASSGTRHLMQRRPADENEAETVIEYSLGDIPESLPALVRDICAPMFTLFDFSEFSDHVYEDIVRRFERGEAS